VVAVGVVVAVAVGVVAVGRLGYLLADLGNLLDGRVASISSISAVASVASKMHGHGAGNHTGEDGKGLHFVFGVVYERVVEME